MTRDARSSGWPHVVAGASAALVALVGACVLAGWSLGIQPLKSPIPGLPSMAPEPALGFLLAGLSLGLLARRDAPRGLRRAGQGLAVAMGLLSALTLVERLVRWSPWLDALLFKSEPGAPGTLAPSPSTSLNLLLLSCALLALDRKTRRGWRPAELLSLLATMTALLALAGYVYGAPSLYLEPGVLPKLGMSAHSAVAFLVLAAGIFCARPEAGLMSILASEYAGGMMSRRLLIGALTIPLLGLLALAGQRAGMYDPPLTAAFLAVAATLVALGLILSTGSQLNRADAEQRRAVEEAKKVERALRRSEEQFRQLFEQAADGIFIADLDGRYTDVNGAACRMLGYSREELVGKTIFDLIPAENVERLWQDRARLQAGGSHISEWRLRRKDGTYLPVEVSTRILPDGRWQAIVRDFTERKELERMREEWASVVAHDLRQPVGGIVLAADLLARRLGELSAADRRTLERIRTAARRLNRMIDDLLDVSRLEAHRLTLDRRRVRLPELIQEAIELLGEPAHRCQMRLARGAEEEVWADPGRIAQVLGNLLSNAVKYGAPGTEIRITVEGHDGEVEVTVANEGPGIPPGELRRLFSRFERGRDAKAGGVFGVGLGLYISKGLVEAHGGRIWAESPPGGMTSFHFTLPLPPPAIERRGEEAPAPPP